MSSIMPIITSTSTLLSSGLGYALIPKLADFVLNGYNWQCVNAFFALLCFLSSVFGVLLTPLECTACKNDTVDKRNEIAKIRWDEKRAKRPKVHAIKHITSDIHNNDQFLNSSDQFLNPKVLPYPKMSYGNIVDMISTPYFVENENTCYSKSTSALSYRVPEVRFHETQDADRLCFEKNASFCLTGISGEFCYARMYPPFSSPDKANHRFMNICHTGAETFGNSKFSPIFKIDVAMDENPDDQVSTVSRMQDTLLKSKKLDKTLNAFLDNAFRVSFFRNRNFSCICICNILVFMALNIPFAFGPDMMVRRNIMSRESGSNLIIPIGLTSMLVMPTIGLLIDKGPKLNPILVTLVSLVSAGISTIAFLFCNTEVEAVFIAIWFGVSFSAILSLPPIILERLIGKEDMKSSFSLLVLLRGVSISIGGPLAGQIYDHTKAYDGAFYFAGGLFLFASIPLLAIYLDQKKTTASSQV